MSGPHDTTPPPAAPTTSPELPGPIPTGKAHVTIAGGFLEVLTAMARLEAVCAAVARQLDATTQQGGTTT
jgi:hypothetical protein